MKNSSRTKMTRLPKRGSYDPAVVYGILDEALICHVSYNLNGQPFVIPISFCRLGDTVYLHGSVGSHFLRELARGVPVAVAVTLVDGLVLARSAFSHSMNYRSAVLFGQTRLVEDEDESMRSLEQLTEHLIPGRWKDTRRPTPGEMKKTMVIAIDIEEASAKIRTGNANDEESDLDLPFWAGVIPLTVQAHAPEAHAAIGEAIPTPDYVANYRRGRAETIGS